MKRADPPLFLVEFCPCGEDEDFYRYHSRPRVRKCKRCGRQWAQFGCTPFERSKLLPEQIEAACWLFNENVEIRPIEMTRALGVNYRTGWRLVHLMRSYYEDVCADEADRP